MHYLQGLKMEFRLPNTTCKLILGRDTRKDNQV
jgi:hypothetical protein